MPLFSSPIHFVEMNCFVQYEYTHSNQTCTVASFLMQCCFNCVCVTVTHSYPTPKNKNDYSMGNLALLLFGVKSQQYYREEKKKQLTTGVIVRRGRIRRSRRRGEKHQIIAIVSLCNWFSLLHARHTRRTFALLHLCYYGERSLTSRKKSEINKSNLLINKWRREREKKSWEYFASRRTTHTHTTKRKPRGYSKPFI